MEKTEIIDVLQGCLPIYEKFIAIPQYRPTEEENQRLSQFLELCAATEYDNSDLLEQAGFNLDMIAKLIGYYSKVL